MEQRTDPATPEELSQFAQELICGCALIATPEELSQFALIAELERADRRDNAIRFAQARRRRDNAIQFFLNLAREQVDLSEDDSPVFCDTRYSFSPGYWKTHVVSVLMHIHTCLYVLQLEQFQIQSINFKFAGWCKCTFWGFAQRQRLIYFGLVI